HFVPSQPFEKERCFAQMAGRLGAPDDARGMAHMPGGADQGGNSQQPEGCKQQPHLDIVAHPLPPDHSLATAYSNRHCVLHMTGCQTRTFTMAKYLFLVAVLLGASACGDTWGQRAVTGGGIGAGSGALLGALTPIGILPGALVGGAVGAGVGAATTPRY